MSEGKKLYIGGLSETTSKEDVEAFFAKYGKLENVWIARNPAGFAFVTYEEAADAQEAVRTCDGEQFQGRSLKVEVAKNNGKRRETGDRRGGRGGDERRGDDRRGGRRDEPRRRSRSRDRRY
jgi:RNA recognition motif-containing protein